MNRWKPKNGEMYWYVWHDGHVYWDDFTGASDERHFKFGNCFKTKAEAEAAAEKVKALLLSLHGECENLQPTCNQLATDLPKLTAEVFDRPDCPEWAQWAIISPGGYIAFFKEKPEIYDNGIVLKGDYVYIWEKKYSAENWQNSLVEREVAKLPDWCKVGEWVWDEGNGYGEIKSVRDDRSACYIEFKSDAGDFVPEAFAKLKETRLMSYDHLSISEALGKAVSNESAVGIVTGYDIATVRVFGKFIPFNVFRGLFRYLDGSPCGVLEHLEEGEWVK